MRLTICLGSTSWRILSMTKPGISRTKLSGKSKKGSLTKCQSQTVIFSSILIKKSPSMLLTISGTSFLFDQLILRWVIFIDPQKLFKLILIITKAEWRQKSFAIIYYNDHFNLKNTKLQSCFLSLDIWCHWWFEVIIDFGQNIFWIRIKPINLPDFNNGIRIYFNHLLRIPHHIDSQPCFKRRTHTNYELESLILYLLSIITPISLVEK